jgi:hypothetical protein
MVAPFHSGALPKLRTTKNANLSYMPPSTKPPQKQQTKKAQEKKLELFFDHRDSSYLLKISGRYVSLKKSDLFMHLRVMGFRDDVFISCGEGSLRELDHVLYMTQQKQMIDYAGSLAGHRVGVFGDGSNRRFLVTDECSGVWADLQPKPPQPKLFIEAVQELLPGGQWTYFCHWLAVALRSLRRGDFRPGQVAVLAGPAKCGKSLMQNWITEILGGRSANPFRYMMGLTQFNKDLIGAEHWQIEDPATTTDIRARRQFGSMLKECTVNRDISIHQKGKDALSLPMFRRVTISVNDEPENLAVVPPLDPSIRDKVFLFHCSPIQKAFERFRAEEGTTTLPGIPSVMASGELDSASIWKAVQEETPLVRAWLLSKFKNIPEDLRDDRFGIVAWHHPDLRSELSALAPETRLLQLVDVVLWEEDKDQGMIDQKWEGKSMDLEAELRSSPRFSYEAEKVLRFNGACPAYLGKLSKTQPARISKRVINGYTLWTINPPLATKEIKTNGL